MLFVGLAHTLLLESYVSRMKAVEKKHPHTHALTLDALFMYKVCASEQATSKPVGILPCISEPLLLLQSLSPSLSLSLSLLL